MREISNTSPKDIEPEIAHVLFTDIVGYSKLTMDEQTHLRAQLKEIVRATDSYRRAQNNQKTVSRSTGDGMALVFFGHPAAPVDCAIQISRALRSLPILELRMGIHTGPVRRDADINDQLDVAGGGINLAQRVMDIGGAGHILLSKAVAENLWQLGGWDDFLHDLGEAEVKHGARIHIFNLYGEDFGNSNLPERLGAANSRPKTSSSATLAPEPLSKKTADLTKVKASGDSGIVHAIDAPVAPSTSHAAVIRSADPDITAALIKPSGYEFPLRWKLIVLSGLLGMVLGLICAGVLAHHNLWFSIHHEETDEVEPIIIPPLPEVLNSLNEKKKQLVLLVGSGTVYRHLIASHFFDDLRNYNITEVQVAEAPTGTGVKIFASASDSENIIFIVMASEKLKIEDLNQFTGKPSDAFEAYLGADGLEMLYAAGSEKGRDTSSMEVAFLKEKQIDSEALDKIWKTNQYDVYAGMEESATKKLWKEILGGAWPATIYTWDIRDGRQILNWQSNSKPRIYLGSEVLNETLSPTLDQNNIPNRRITLIDKSHKPVKRGLYLYGVLDFSKSSQHGPTHYGPNLPKAVAYVLYQMFNSLKSRKHFLNDDCRKAQIKYFNLRSPGEGWVNIYPGHEDHIYRAKPCKEQPDK